LCSSKAEGSRHIAIGVHFGSYFYFYFCRRKNYEVRMTLPVWCLTTEGHAGKGWLSKSRKFFRKVCEFIEYDAAWDSLNVVTDEILSKNMSCLKCADLDNHCEWISRAVSEEAWKDFSAKIGWNVGKWNDFRTMVCWHS
jgi:hypothetical protein